MCKFFDVDAFEDLQDHDWKTFILRQSLMTKDDTDGRTQKGVWRVQIRFRENEIENRINIKTRKKSKPRFDSVGQIQNLTRQDIGGFGIPRNILALIPLSMYWTWIFPWTPTILDTKTYGFGSILYIGLLYQIGFLTSLYKYMYLYLIIYLFVFR